jgi:hypothetical protein
MRRSSRLLWRRFRGKYQLCCVGLETETGSSSHGGATQRNISIGGQLRGASCGPSLTQTLVQQPAGTNSRTPGLMPKAPVTQVLQRPLEAKPSQWLSFRPSPTSLLRNTSTRSRRTISSETGEDLAGRSERPRITTATMGACDQIPFPHSNNQCQPRSLYDAGLTP